MAKQKKDIGTIFAEGILARMSNADLLSFHTKIVEAQWGERCPDHEPGCPVCDAWAKFDSDPEIIALKKGI